MNIDRKRIRSLLKAFDLGKLFREELGWDRIGSPLIIPIDGHDYQLTPAAGKRGLTAYVCAPGPNGELPNAASRRRIQKQVARSVFEHVIVFTDASKTIQVWQWVKREVGKPLAVREHFFSATQSGEALAQKLEQLAVSLEEEERLTVVDVADRVRLAFDVERPSKRFYDRFQNEHKAFLKLIAGIGQEGDREWYASVMLNRLMFVYFIQKKGFLDGDKNYLRTRMQMVRAQAGKGRFHSFYRQFLLRLFYEGLGQRENARSKDVDALIGRVPYLNGGMFVPHQLEEQYDGIHIPDEAFEALLNFFDEFQWHLDDRPVRQDNEINPDVLGFIFERYINQKANGAYYTKEDVTEYIGRVCIIPRLLDMVREAMPGPFAAGGFVWRLLQADPERYLMPSLKVGEDAPLPGDVDASLPTASAPAPETHALPRETWRGVIDRRRHLEAARSAIAAGEVQSSDALVTWNLDVRQLAQDIVDNCDSPELLRAFYVALTRITILDPTCGSGAFLFAALNILEPLYEAVLDRMAVFAAEAERTGWMWDRELQSQFRDTLSAVAKHRNRAYFVYRSITVNNLYGVDLMEEAVEICKLRLFLKLASQVEEYGDIEPLPDIDFNIRAGNTLVGFVRRPGASGGALDLAGTMEQAEKDAAEVEELFVRYRDLQTNADGRSGEVVTTKRELASRLSALDVTLDRELAGEYGIFDTRGKPYRDWRKAHFPFHWWANFYAQMQAGGFDVLIGNPPYVQSAKVRKAYSVNGLKTAKAPDIYAWVLERVAELLKAGGRSGMIVPLSLGFSSNFATLRELLYTKYQTNWFSSFGRIPSALFNHDVRVRNTIHIGRKAEGAHDHRAYTTRLHRWFEEERSFLFDTIMYAGYTPKLWGGRVPKVHSQALIEALERNAAKTIGPLDTAMVPGASRYVLHFKKSAYNWLNFCRVLPPCFDAKGKKIEHTEFGDIYFPDSETRDLAFLLLNGKWSFAFWYLLGDDFHVTRWMFGELPVSISSIPPKLKAKLLALAPELETAMKSATSFKLNAGKKVGNYNLARCRHVTDRSDLLFAQAFGWGDVWADVELLYSQAVKTSFSDEDQDEEE